MPPVVRTLPSEEAQELLALTRDLADGELAPRAAAGEAAAEFPRELFRTLGKAGLLGLPYPEEHGGAAQPYEVYLQVLEELSRAWLAVGLGVSVHTLSCYPLFAFGTDEPDDAAEPPLDAAPEAEPEPPLDGAAPEGAVPDGLVPDGA